MKEIPRRYWRNFDWPLLVAALLLVGIGLVTIYSASHARLAAAGDDPFHFVKRQLVGLAVGLVAMAIAFLLDYQVLRRYTKALYISSLSLLIAILFIGTTVFGSQRWIRIGPMNLQPSEVAKIVLIIVLAHYLEDPDRYAGWKMILPFVITGVPMGLILVQPDMGTSMVFVGIVFSMTFMAGVNWRHLSILAAAGGAVMAAAIISSLQGWISVIKPYQLNRLLVFVDPYADPTGAGWNVIQSMIAIGSGGFLGRGYLSGSQNQLNFLPANHTDFVFSVIAEEWGFVGTLVVLSLFLFLIWRGLLIAARAKDSFGSLMALGCVSMFFVHLFINVGMTLGIMPVTGLPLPFITYGGSTLLTFLIAIGLLLNIGLRRHKIMF